MNEFELFPLYAKPGIRSETDWLFYEANGEIEIGSNADEIEAILSLANGRNSLSQIVEELRARNIASGKASRIISDLQSLGILTDKTQLLVTLHEYTESPSLHTRPITSQMAEQMASEDPFTPRIGDSIALRSQETVLGTTAKSRESCRNFSIEPLKTEVIATCLDTAYSAESRPVPSAGALYPLRVYAIVNADGEIPRGYYQYDHRGSTLVQFNQHPDTEKLKFVFNSDSLLHGAPMILVIAADLGRQTAKYSNRGYRYTLLEAGHSAQNIHLVAGELGLDSLEYGGFQDNQLAKELELDQDEKPLIAVALGYKSETPTPAGTNVGELENLIGLDKPLKSVAVDLESEGTSYMDFFYAGASYCPVGSHTENYTSGSGRSMEEASIKAMAEAYERYMASKVRWDVEAPASELTEAWMNPTSAMPLSREQLETMPVLAEFDPEKTIQWVRARDKNSQPMLVPIDFVFYPLSEEVVGRKLIADVTSSGMAAHPNLEVATKNALLELVERDAIMRFWFSKQSPERIDPMILSDHIARRVEFWRQENRDVEFLNLSDRGVPVCLAMIRSESNFPFFLAGASAHENSFIEASEKALQEAEKLFIGALHDRGLGKIRPEDVKSPADHGRLYYYGDHKRQIEWLWQGAMVHNLPTPDSKIGVIDKYDPLVVQITKDEEYLQVVRVLCPALVPISFGYRNEYYSHPAIRLTGYTPTLPHFFA